MINGAQFNSVVTELGKEFSKEFYNLQFSNFLNSLTSSSMTVTVPDDLPEDSIKKVGEVTSKTIKELSSDIIKNAVDTNTKLDIDNIRKMSNPQDFTEQISKIIVDHVDAEWNTRQKVLETMFEKQVETSGGVGNLSEENYKALESYAKQHKFVNREVVENLKMSLQHHLSMEGEDIIESIKNDIVQDIEKTEEKNAIVRDAILEINEKKKEIEESINEGVEDVAEAGEEIAEETSSTDENESVSLESFRITDFIDTYKSTESVEVEFSSGLGLEGLSREDIISIKQDFSKLEGDLSEIDKLDTDALSVSDTSSDEMEDSSDKDAPQSQEVFGDDEDQEKYEINEEVFNYNDDNMIKPEVLSEESYAKAILPLSINKFMNNETSVNYKKLSVLMACTKDRGNEFFSNVNMRVANLQDMIQQQSRESDDLNVTVEVNDKLSKVAHELEDCRQDSIKVMEKFGILGILDDHLKLTDDKITNSVKMVVFPEYGDKLAKKSTESITNTKDYVEIFKMGLETNRAKENIINGVDVVNNTEKLGDLEELINEKLLTLDGSERSNVESKLEALTSLESFMPINNIAEFIKTLNPVRKVSRTEVENIKDIGMYGFSYDDMVTEIINKVTQDHKVKADTYNIDIDSVVKCVCESVDTTKFDPTLYERILVNLMKTNDAKNSTEAVIIRNKGKALLSTIVASERLGILSYHDRVNILSQLA